jgi:predicted secreted protein
VDVSDSAGTDMKTIAGQTNLVISSSGNVINLSNKDTGAVECVTMGRLSETVTLDGLMATSCEGQTALFDAYHNRTSVTIAYFKDGVEVEGATAVITGLTKTFQDEAVATFNCSLQCTTAWS